MSDAWERTIDEMRERQNDSRRLTDREEIFRRDMAMVLSTMEGRRAMNYIFAGARLDMYLLGADTTSLVARAAVHDFMLRIRNLLTTEQIRNIEDSVNE